MSPKTTPRAERAIAPTPPEIGAEIPCGAEMGSLVVVILDPILWTGAMRSLSMGS